MTAIKVDVMTDNAGEEMNIVGFLEARIAEDEDQASKHLPALSSHGLGDYGLRVLAECQAKRAIIDAHPITSDVIEVSTRIKHGYACETCFSYGDVVEDHGYCDTIRALAAVYKDHPDYQQEWATDAH